MSIFVESIEFPDVGVESLPDYIISVFGSVRMDHGLNFLVYFVELMSLV